MILDCTIFVETANGKPMGRPSKGILSFAKEKSGRQESSAAQANRFLVITTTKANNLRKIKLTNLVQIWSNSINKGSISLKFRDPDCHIYISEAKPSKLRSFLLYIRDENSTDGGGSASSSAIPETNNQHNYSLKELSIGSLEITNGHKYPNRSGKGKGSNSFPPNLRKLEIHSVSLRGVDSRWFSLQKLCYLSLRNNLLGKNWNIKCWRKFCSISQLEKLLSLDLSGNMFGCIPDFFLDALPSSLREFKLDQNGINKLSNRISRLQQLQLLDLSGNPIEELPDDLCLLPNLRHLNLSSMSALSFLPSTLFLSSVNYDRFTQLDVSGNILYSNALLPTLNESAQFGGLPSLSELSAAALLNNSHLNSPSTCLLPEVANCLPLMVRSHMREWLRRCANCFQLYAKNSNQKELFACVQLRRFVSVLLGPSPAHVRVQLCFRCAKIHALLRPPFKGVG